MKLNCGLLAVLLAVVVACIVNLVDAEPRTYLSKCRRNGRYYYDRCRQRCYCSRNRLVRCTRIRKEFTSMTFYERYRYVRTIKTASTHPRYKAAYNKLITDHRRLFETGIHEVEHFLTWHRYYLLQYENFMRKIYCRFTVSYWDWSLVSANPWRTNIFSPWVGGSVGMGGNGSLPNSCVQTGTFREKRWKLPPSADNRCLQRVFFGNPPDAVAVEQLLRTPPSRFLDFELTLRFDLHDNVHCNIGGTMCSIDSAAAPEFFLHHGMVDKIWADWQKKSSAHKNAYFGSRNGKVLHTPYYPKQLIDLNNQPGGVRVVYRNARNYWRVKRFLRRLSMSLLKRIPRRGYSGMLQKTIRLFKIPKNVLRRVQKLGRALQPRRRIAFSRRRRPTGGKTKSKTKSMESSIGFKLKVPKK